MAERCDLSDLPVDQCACRVHAHAETDIETEPPSGARTTARYPGHCEGCSERIAVGDPIVRDTTGYWICEECA